MKIYSNFKQSANRYLLKNTVRAKYNRNMDTALISGLITGGEVFRIPYWDPHDIGITAFMGSVYLRSIGKAIKHLIELQPIRKRAIKIKKSSNKNS